MAAQMTAVAVGWQVYSIHHRAFDLGLIGLLEFAPLPLLALPAGHVADRLPRRRIMGAAFVLEGAVAGALLAVTLSGARELWPFLLLAFAGGVAVALGTPAARALPPMLVPPELLAGALATRSVAFQIATTSGPALGGVLFAIRPELVYAIGAGLLLASVGCAVALREPRSVERLHAAEPPPGLASVLGGIRFIRSAPILLGAISLDLFAVLFGGAVALLPLYAQSILHVGPTGFGVLRSAPSVGALLAALWLTRRPTDRRIGRTLLLVIGLFGASMVVFGLSRWFAVSAVALAVSGLVDMFSVNIRSTTVAVATPDALRGRVLAVEMVFISASNELGAFESGAAAALVGAVPAVVAGGAFTIALAIASFRLFPQLASVDRFEDVRPAAG